VPAYKTENMPLDIDKLKARVDSLLQVAKGEGGPVSISSEIFQGTLGLLGSIYGPDSHQVLILKNLAEEIFANKAKDTRHLWGRIGDLTSACRGALNNLKSELDAGLPQNLQKRLAGEVLTDLIQLARHVLSEPDDKAKNVAAVLAAAAFEDVIRRMGSQFAGVMGPDDLSNIIEALKRKETLESPQLGIAVSYLKFRNSALHADWETIERASVASVLGFVEQLLLAHF